MTLKWDSKKITLIFIAVFVNEASNDQAAQALEIVLTYIKKTPSLGLSVQLMQIDGNRTDSRRFLENSNGSHFPNKISLLTPINRIKSEKRKKKKYLY